MKKKDTEAQIAELSQERASLADELQAAREKAKYDVIEGREPSPDATALSERIAIIDEALVELEARLEGQVESEDRARRTRLIETAIDRTSDRAKLAKRVDDALDALTAHWASYQDALRKDIGTVTSAGGNIGALDRALANNRIAEPLVKALIQSGGVSLARALAVDSPIRAQHATTLADLEARVAQSLRVAQLHIKATSPQPNMARAAQEELERIAG